MTGNIVVTRDGQAQLRAWAADLEDVMLHDVITDVDDETLRAVVEGLLAAAGDEKADLV